MLSALAAVAAGVAAGERDYRLTVRAEPGTQIALRAKMPEGWIAAFCTSSVCAPGHVVVRIPRSGTSAIALHVYRVQRDAGRRGRVVVDDGRGKPLTLSVAF
jgi:hypothetical protein